MVSGLGTGMLHLRVITENQTRKAKKWKHNYIPEPRQGHPRKPLDLARGNPWTSTLRSISHTAPLLPWLLSGGFWLPQPVSDQDLKHHGLLQREHQKCGRELTVSLTQAPLCCVTWVSPCTSLCLNVPTWKTRINIPTSKMGCDSYNCRRALGRGWRAMTT